MRKFLVLLACIPAVGCSPRTEAGLPDAGTVYSDKTSGIHFRVTWAGTTTYNRGACPEVGTLCVHLTHEAGVPLATELAVPFDDFQSKFALVKY